MAALPETLAAGRLAMPGESHLRAFARNAFPFLVLVIAIIAMLGPSIFNMFVAIWITSWVAYARIMRAQTVVAKRQQYVLAARALGYGRLRVMLRNGGFRMPVNDSWIAATAMALQVPVVTQDDDYVEVSGLSVIRV